MDNSGGPTYFTVLDNKNRVVHSGVTPQQVTLKSSSAPFRPAKYQVIYASQSEVQQFDVNTSINWWTAGNIIIGGVPGIVVDAGTGALWKLQPAVNGKVASNEVVVDAEQGAAVLAAYSGDRSSGADDTVTATQPKEVRQASFDDSASTPSVGR